MSTRLDVFFPLPLTNRGPGYTCGMIARGMASRELDVTVVTPRARGRSIYPARIIQALPYWARYVPYRWVRSIATSKIYPAFSAQVNAAPSQTHAAYIWPDASIDAIRELKQANVKIFREMINCHRGTAKKILDDAYTRLGVAPNHTITEASVIAEQEALEAVDYVFCPNLMVETSLLENGLPASKIVPASYGWDPARFHGSTKVLEPCEGLTAVFAGTICVRKGCHLLLEYWAKSKVRGRLVLAGAMEPTIKEKCAALLARDDVMVLDFVPDVGALYRSADVFVFPSLEEGGPQVTYEACGCRLPVLTTPMGAGRIVRHGQEGFVLDPFDGPSWIAAIQSLAEDNKRRANMSAAATQRAQLFRWDAVAERRKKQLLQRLSDNEPVCGSTSGYADDLF
jgi:glycosyltransferase involved in cell wall biosynthesis